MFNPVIVVAFIIQAIVVRFSRLAGAILGYVITSGIFIWGLSVYAEGHRITFFSIPLSLPVFIILCVIWYWLDTRGFVRARKKQPSLENASIPQIQISDTSPDEAITARRSMLASNSALFVCPNCKMNVLPKSDGTCPSCQAKLIP